MAEIRNIWPALRAILPEYFTFNNIKTIVAAAGLDVHKLFHLQQKSGSSVSKGNLLDGIDGVLNNLEYDTQNRIVTHCISEMVRLNPRCTERLEELLPRFGWGLNDGEPYPIKLQMTLEIKDLPEPIQSGLHKSLRRYRDGDVSGAITAICGIVDQLTEKVYNDHKIGDHKGGSYNERVSKAYGVFEDKFKNVLHNAGFQDDEISRVWQNQRKSISEAAYVLGSYRRNISDAHGERSVPKELAQHVLDSATFIIRSISIYL